jgi:hypothetical protein
MNWIISKVGNIEAKGGAGFILKLGTTEAKPTKLF